ncbi:MAG: enoyl-CoA hydratase/isomerase family protein [Halioglobus sp.]|nr:enoyl-CoA hydratase/isomerase family protein [Halioglobus sp.]
MTGNANLSQLAMTPLEQGGSGAVDDSNQHWQVRREQDILWLLLDHAQRSANVLSEEVLQELDALLRSIHSQPPRGLVIRSLKRNGFIYGADITEFRSMTDKPAIVSRLEQGLAVLQRLEDLPLPTIALIHGQCLGGGLELALACDFRIARADSKLGFPEVQLGLHPGLGGTARLTRTIAPHQALQMMLTGKPVSARRARSLGLVDAVGEERDFANAVRDAVAGKLRSRAGGAPVRASRNLPARWAIAGRARSETAKRVQPQHYPAPFRLLDLWQQHGQSTASLLRAEPESFAESLCGDTAQNLIRVFMLRERLKSQGSGQHSPDPVRHVHLIGAGAMGGDIGAWCAWQGLQVTLEDLQPQAIAPAMQRAHKLFERKAPGDARTPAAWDRLVPDLRGAGRSRADLVIEAIPERQELKQKLYRELEPQLKPAAILASNTSSIPLTSLAETLQHPERFVGIHFFNPVSRMQLVEVVRHKELDSEVLQRALAFTTTIDRLPVAVESSPGFLVNRALTPYLLEAMALLDEGVEAQAIDAAATAFGMPMGPVELADQIGLNICLDVADALQKNLDEAQASVPDWLREKVTAGHLGKKSGEGLYKYTDGEPQKSGGDSRTDEQLQDRLILPLLNTCMKCLSHEVVPDAETLDAAMIFGTGFAPFRGGPMHYARQRGHREIAAALEELTRQFGERFTPDPGWYETTTKR